MGDAVGDKGGLQGLALQGSDQLQCGTARIYKDEVVGMDETGGQLSNALLLDHGLVFLGGHALLIGEESVVRRRVAPPWTRFSRPC